MNEPKKLGLRARQKAERPGEILEAAFEEFVSKGFIAARVEDIAARVGVTKGTVYFYFDTKERLFAETVAHVTAAIALNVEQSRQSLEGSYAERLRTFVRSIYAQMTQHPQGPSLLRLLIAEAPRFPELIEQHHDRFIAPAVAMLARVIEEGVAAGEFGKSALLKFPQMVMSPMLLLTFWHLRFGNRRPVDIDSFVEAHLELIMNGLRGER